MRLNSIELEWFRGAADQVALPLKGKSVVIYGPNGAGKSSFVDAVEYFLCEGKIGHLAHEYSGKKQEKGVINTHKPTLKPTRATLTFVDKTTASVDVRPNGTFALTGDGQAHIGSLDYRRVVLRQDEVSAFVSSPKGEKYSALLPLLGLKELEFAAENVRQLSRRVAKATDLDHKTWELEQNLRKSSKVFAGLTDIEASLSQLHSKYLGSAPRQANHAADCTALEAVIRARVAELTPDVQRYAALQVLSTIALTRLLDECDGAATKIADLAANSLHQRIAIIENALDLLQSEGDTSIQCPACGSVIERSQMESHLLGERERLREETKLVQTYNVLVDALAAEVAKAKASVGTHPVEDWWTRRGSQDAGADLQWVRDLNPSSVRGSSATEVRTSLRDRLVPIIAAAGVDSASAPLDTRDLLQDSETVRAATALLTATDLAVAVARATLVIRHLESVETALRVRIRETADSIIEEISADIQRMWSVLHPGREIEDVRLSHPDESEKAIDLELKFFGVDQRSPRLTLSEGNRNSLGLCVFLAMALRGGLSDPVILDDVVVSLDRDYRGMIVDVLQREFSERQLVVLTHDRDWFAELRLILGPTWDFYVLRPYLTPADGISWSSKLSTLDDARAHLAIAPDGAANIARKIMDTELGLLAEKLNLRLEYKHGLRNDHRMAHEFLEVLAKASSSAFQRRNDGGLYVVDSSVARQLLDTDKLILAWANRGSHSFDVTRTEAEKLLNTCETALALFRCSVCEKNIFKLDDANGTKQCECGAIQWRYGKLT